MINFIGAYIVSILMMALVFHRQAALALLDELEQIALPGLIGLYLLMTLIFVEALDLYQPGKLFSLLGLPHLILDIMTMWIHEAGHAFLCWAGEFLHILGGTLLQLIFPFTMILIGAKRHLIKTVALGTFWLGFSLMGVSKYMMDAQERALPLLGTSDPNAHDWYNLLTMLNLLPYDDILGGVVYLLGITVSIAGFGILRLKRSQLWTHPDSSQNIALGSLPPSRR
jgi:hypothetical protein